MNDFLSLKEACEVAHVSRWTMHRWVTSGLVHTVRDGYDKFSPVCVHKPSLLAHLASLENEPKKA